MISVTTAKELVLHHTNTLPGRRLPLLQLAGLTLAEDIFSRHDFPPFRQSSMDGYAFCFTDWKNEPLTINGEVQAGAGESILAGPKQAVRIFTGAPVPDGTDTVVMQEKVLVANGLLTILDDSLQPGANVRPKGAEMESGALGLNAGTYLLPGAIGFIAGLGIKEVLAIPQPVVSIIVTGKELQQPGTPLLYGQVYQSNSFALTAALKQLGIATVTTRWAEDNLDELSGIIQQELKTADLLLLNGGVSVGDYDFVTKALEANGVETIFHKIKQKPGKPLLFGTKGNKIVFGLPGNPSSVLTCFYEYVLLALQQMMRLPKPLLHPVQLPLGAGYTKTPGLTHFLKGRIANGQAFPLNAQESFRMKSFAMANCLIVLSEEKSAFEKGDLVEVHPLTLNH